VEWNHEMHLGNSVWLESGVPPHAISIGEHVE
jgi:hypothetical protein